MAGNSLVLAGQSVLTDMAADVKIVADPLGHGVFLRCAAGAKSSRWIAPVGRPIMQRFMACHRYEPFWMKPCAGVAGHEIPVETQSLLVELPRGAYALFIPIVDGPVRCALQGRDDDQLLLVAETGSPAVQARSAVGLFVAAGEDPYKLAANAAKSVCRRMKNCRLRTDKPLPPFIDSFGWCTWDAFYQDVSHEKIRQGLESFARGGVQPKFLLIDDGWQSVVRHEPTGTTRLTSFRANEKFPGDLAATVRMAKGQLGVRDVLVWHTLQGYWGGVDARSFPDHQVGDVVRDFSPGVLHHWPQANEQFWGAAAGLVAPEHFRRFIRDYHRHLHRQGIDGVKIDNQATQEGLAHKRGGRVAEYRRCRRAIEDSVRHHFRGNLINCMACANDNLYAMRDSVLTRTSTDFWPNRPETHGLHLWTNAQVSYWFGQFVHGDWDMFQSGHPWAAFHAAARAVSGGPVYVSDQPGFHDFALLRKLVCSDGSVLRCAQPGQPTRDCLFSDPTRADVLLKIFNYAGGRASPRAGVVGVFNCRNCPTAGAPRALRGTVGPDDIPHLRGQRFVVYRHQARRLREISRHGRIAVALKPGQWEIVTVAPIKDGFAAIGLADKFNSAGAICSLRRPSDRLVELTLRDGGTVLTWAQRRPKMVLSNGQSIPFTWRAATLRIRLPLPGSRRLTIKW